MKVGEKLNGVGQILALFVCPTLADFQQPPDYFCR
jgi:hypothetical protein